MNRAPDRPSRVGRYELRSLLGEGGMARVWRAWDPQLKREVALKVPNSNAMKRWSREATAVARLNHPNIITIFDIGEADGQPYLAMELIEGKELEDVWKDWTLRQRLEALRRVAAAVGHANAKGVVHRDLKPGNVMVTSEGEIKVVDFGLARVAGERSLTLTGALIGSPAYMAPEQVRGDHGGPPIDVYSIGVMLYEALTGDIPFNGPNARAIYDKIVNEEPVPPTRLSPGIPVDLETVCLKAMDKDPDRRYPDAVQLGEELQRWLDGEGIRARPSTFATKVVRRAKRAKWVLAAVGAVLLVGAIGAVATVMAGRSAGSEARADVLAQESALAYAGGDLDASRAKAEAALAQAPAHPAARYWLARVKLREFQRRRGLPDVHMTAGMLFVSPPLPDSPEDQKLRREILDAFRGNKGQAIAEGVLAMWDGDYDQARERFARAGAEAGSASWEAKVLEAQCLYYLGRFDEAEGRLKPLLGLDPRAVDPTWGRLCIARGLQSLLRGREGAEWFNLADAAGARLEQAGEREAGRVLQARALVDAARVEYRRGRDPLERIQKALDALAGHAGAEALVTAGDAHVLRADFLQSRGRLDPEQPEDFVKAVAAYEQGLAARPGYGYAALRRGEAHRAWSQFLHNVGRPREAFVEKARDDFRRALSIDSNDVESALGLVWAEGVLARVDQSSREQVVEAQIAEITKLGELIRKHPKFPPLRWVRGQAYSALADIYRARGGGDPIPCYEKGIQDAEAAATLGHSFHEGWSLKGSLLGELAIFKKQLNQDPGPDYEAAVQAFEQALKISPDNPQILAARGGLHRNRGLHFSPKDPDPRRHFETSVADYTTAIRLQPGWPYHYSSRAFAYRDWGSSSRQDPDRAIALYQEAVKDLAEALRLNPRLSDTHRVRAMTLQYLANLLEGRGRDPVPILLEALKSCDAAIQSDPGYAKTNIGIYMCRANVVLELGQRYEAAGRDPREQYESAIADCGKGIAINPKNADMYRVRARAHQARAALLARAGQDARPHLEEALGDLGTVVELVKGQLTEPLRRSDRGDLAMSLGRNELAVEDYQAAIKGGVRTGALHLRLGVCQARLGRFAEARKSLATAAEIDPQLAPEVERIKAQLPN